MSGNPGLTLFAVVLGYYTFGAKGLVIGPLSLYLLLTIYHLVRRGRGRLFLVFSVLEGRALWVSWTSSVVDLLPTPVCTLASDSQL